MPFIRSFSIDSEKQQPFPFNIPAVRFAKQVKLNERVKIFVGDNGSGKSTLLESIAYRLGLPLIGGYIGASAGFEAARLLKPYLTIEWKWEIAKGFFFRAEDFSHFIDGVEREKMKIMMDLQELKGKDGNPGCHALPDRRGGYGAGAIQRDRSLSHHQAISG